MKHESPAHQGRTSADGLNVGNQSSERDRRNAWAKVPRDAAMKELPKDALRLLIVLSSFADGRTRIAWPGQNTLALELGWVTRSTGQPDRRRVARVLSTLIEADLVRNAGRHRHGVRAWTSCYLVAPYPVEDAATTYASSSVQRSEDAYENGLKMRTNHVEDATTTYARTDPKNRPKRTEAPSKEANEDQEPEPEPEPERPGSAAWFNHPRGPRWRHAS